MKVVDFDYDLPKKLIAQHPIEPRDASRLMVLHKASGLIEHRKFGDILDYLDPGDGLVINETKVLPARLFGKKVTGAVIEVVLLKQMDAHTWEALVRPGKKARQGTRLIFAPGILEGEVMADSIGGGRYIKFIYQGNFFEILDTLGQMPLPPYIREKLKNKERYQTIYARELGSAAAPTAGLHFTYELMEQIKKKDVQIIDVLLHVGLGTFRPIKAENIEEHKMHSEYYEVNTKNALAINQIKKEGGKIISVGTTSTRTLETVATALGQVEPGQGFTESYIYPGYDFQVVDALITNFHLPKSTLLMLVSALGGHENIRRAYFEAIREQYRFFSFGDAMLII